MWSRKRLIAERTRVNIETLVTHLRTRLNDFGPYLRSSSDWMNDDADMFWTNEELTDYLNQAQKEYTRRFPIKDSQTAAVCQIAVVAGTSVYTYHESILDIHRAKLASDTYPLTIITAPELDEVFDDWESTTGTPTHFIMHADTGKLQLYPIPSANDTLNLQVGRRALEALDWDFSNRDPEVPEAHQWCLIDWASHLAYLKEDTEATFKPDRSEYFRAKFDHDVGGDMSYKAAEARHQTATRRVTRTYY